MCPPIRRSCLGHLTRMVRERPLRQRETRLSEAAHVLPQAVTSLNLISATSHSLLLGQTSTDKPRVKCQYMEVSQTLMVFLTISKSQLIITIVMQNASELFFLINMVYFSVAGASQPAQIYTGSPYTTKDLPLAQQILGRQSAEPGHSVRRSPPPVPTGVDPLQSQHRPSGRVPPKPPPRRSPPSSQGSTPPSGEPPQHSLVSGAYLALGEDCPLVGDTVIQEQEKEDDESRIGLLSG